MRRGINISIFLGDKPIDISLSYISNRRQSATAARRRVPAPTTVKHLRVGTATATRRQVVTD